MADITRRELGAGSAAAAAFTLVPRRALGGPGYQPPSETINIAGVGVGGMGLNYLKGCESQNIAALCDVDDDYAAPTFRRYPKARTYRDFREMLDKEKGIDAVIVGTPDHTHAAVSMAAMKAGKGVYCAKPLTRTVAEARALAKTAKEMKVATQMSVQSCASDPAVSTEEWVKSGVIGKVREVHVWSNRPIWPQGLARPAERYQVPETLDWDLWIGPAPMRPYHKAYHPWIWRGWWDFGTGAIGDMACHTLHVIVKSLDLGYPTLVSATKADVVRGHRVRDEEGKNIDKPERMEYPETAPHASIITWNFAARGKQPPVQVTWYDGGLQPPRPADLAPDRKLEANGLLFKGDKGTILSGFSGGPELLPASRNARFKPPKKTLPRSTGHYMEWVEACKGGAPAHCEFGFGSFLTEIGLLGCIAVRTGKYLEWDAKAMKFSNEPEADKYIDPPYRTGWSL